MAEPNQGAVRIDPIQGGGSISLLQQGEKITKTAIFDTETGVWYPVELKKPVRAVKASIMGQGVVQLTAGENDEHCYIFNSTKKRWDELDLPEGASSAPFTTTFNGEEVRIEKNTNIYIYNFKDGKWRDVDLGKLLDAAESDGEPAKDKR